MKHILVFIIFLMTINIYSQEKNDKQPYYEVPDYPKEFTAGTTAARMLDALGFRYYWVSDSLTEKDLAYKANEEGRSSEETIKHILRESNDISQYKIIFGEQEIPFWNLVNGPIADAIWHCGQLVIYRRTTGNPINPKVNHFLGKVKD